MTFFLDQRIFRSQIVPKREETTLLRTFVFLNSYLEYERFWQMHKLVQMVSLLGDFIKMFLNKRNKNKFKTKTFIEIV